MHVPNRGSKEINPRSNKILDLVRAGKNALHSGSISHAVFAAFNPARFRFSRNPASVAVRHELLCLRQVFGFLMVRHVDHDGVEGERVGCQAHEGFVLAVVEVDRDWDCCPRGGVGGGSDEEAVGCCDGPWEHLDDEGGAFLFCCSYYGDYLLQIVTELMLGLRILENAEGLGALTQLMLLLRNHLLLRL